jgi:hypothetical protein
VQGHVILVATRPPDKRPTITKDRRRHNPRKPQLKMPLTGTVAVEGEILTVRVEPSQFHYGSEVRMLVRATTLDGGIYRVWATKPVGLSSAGRGDWVHFIAELTRSESDETFAYAKRPRKAYRLIPHASRSATPLRASAARQGVPAPGGDGSEIRQIIRAVNAAAATAGLASQECLPW